jgi:hypothetical protein
MGYCVYEMPAVRDANYQYRPSIEDLKKRLETTDPRPYHQFLPYLEALGQNWFKKRYDNFRLVAKFLPVEVGGRIAPVVVFVDFLPRAAVPTATVPHSISSSAMQGYCRPMRRLSENWHRST